MAAKNGLSRREFVKDTGGLLIGFSLADGAVLPRVLAAAAQTSPTAWASASYPRASRPDRGACGPRVSGAVAVAASMAASGLSPALTR